MKRSLPLMAGLIGLTVFLCLRLTATASAAPCTAAAGSLFFVTDREPLDDNQLFSGERGTAPDGATIVTTGSIAGTPSKANETRCASTGDFMKALQAAFVPNKPRQVLIYVHGYYTSFNSAIEDAAALQKTLRFQGPVIVYSWPAKKTSRLAYGADEGNAAWSMPHFNDFLGRLTKAFPRMPISFAAHSLGSRFPVSAAQFLRDSGCQNCFGRAVLFAPDVDTFALVDGLRASGRCIGKPPVHPLAPAPILLYVSNNDRALRQSQRYHKRQRAGQAGSELILCSGVDTVDVSYFNTGDSTGHSYMTDVPVVEDTAAAFAGIPPTSTRRHLKQVTREGGVYYELHVP